MLWVIIIINNSAQISEALVIIDDSPAPLLSLSLLVTLFLEFWKRRQAELEYEWDTVELQQEEQPRPEYEAQCTHVVINEITQVKRMFYPFIRWFSTVVVQCNHLQDLESLEDLEIIIKTLKSLA